MGGIPSLRLTRGTCSNICLQRTRNWAAVLKLLESRYPWRVFDLGDFFNELDGSIWRQAQPQGFFFPMSKSATLFGRKELRAAVFAPWHNLSSFPTSVRVTAHFLIPCLLQLRFSAPPRFDALTLPNTGTSPGISSDIWDLGGILEFSVSTHQSDCCGI